MDQTDFNPSALTLKNQQHNSNICWFSSLASELFASGETVAAKDISGQTKVSLVYQSNGYSGRIKYDNEIMLHRAQNKGDHNVCYDINKRKIKVSFDILNDISEHVILVLFMVTFVNVNQTVSISGNCVFNSNYNKETPLEKE